MLPGQESCHVKTAVKKLVGSTGSPLGKAGERCEGGVEGVRVELQGEGMRVGLQGEGAGKRCKGTKRMTLSVHDSVCLPKTQKLQVLST